MHMATTQNILVRSLSRDPEQALREMHRCVTIQRAVGWGSEAVPSHVFRADSLGLLTDLVDPGYVLVAEDSASSEIIGFGRVTYTRDPGKHWLHELAVLPQLQGMGTGVKLMMEIRRQSGQGGAKALLFTYDPFDARNGTLYLNKCGGRGIRVFENLYGRSSVPAHGNRFSHRLMVWWNLTSNPVAGSSYDPEEIRLVTSSGEIERGKPFAVAVPAAVIPLDEERALILQKETFPILCTAINVMGYEAIRIEKGGEQGLCSLVLVPGSQGVEAKS
jgi:predicted GNAT superfamily acetyltransferase